MAAVLEVQPGEVHFRVQGFDMHLAVADFHHQDALLGEVVGGFGQHAPHQVQAVVATGQAQGRLVVVLVRHVGEVFGVHIGRIGNDQVEALAGQAVETIALHGVDALFQTMPLDVAVGHFQRLEGQVAEHHFRVGEGIGAGDADAARAGAQVEDARRLGRQPGRETLADQFGNRRARHQHALVHLERQAAEPGLAEQVGGRHAFADAALDQAAEQVALVILQPTVQVGVGHFIRQMQGTQHQHAGLVPGVIGSMPKIDLLSLESADRPANVITQGTKAGGQNGHCVISPGQIARQFIPCANRPSRANGQAPSF